MHTSCPSTDSTPLQPLCPHKQIDLSMAVHSNSQCGMACRLPRHMRCFRIQRSAGYMTRSAFHSSDPTETFPH